jgi:hypothetical protein
MISNSVEDFSRIDLAVGEGGRAGEGSTTGVEVNSAAKLKASHDPSTRIRSEAPIGEENQFTFE